MPEISTAIPGTVTARAFKLPLRGLSHVGLLDPSRKARERGSVGGDDGGDDATDGDVVDADGD